MRTGISPLTWEKVSVFLGEADHATQARREAELAVEAAVESECYGASEHLRKCKARRAWLFRASRFAAPPPERSCLKSAAAVVPLMDTEQVSEGRSAALPLGESAILPADPMARRWVVSLRGGSSLLVHLSAEGETPTPLCKLKSKGERAALRGPVSTGGHLDEARCYSSRVCADCLRALSPAE